jgi:hypothetical protein
VLGSSEKPGDLLKTILLRDFQGSFRNSPLSYQPDGPGARKPFLVGFSRLLPNEDILDVVLSWDNFIISKSQPEDYWNPNLITDGMGFLPNQNTGN